MNFLIKKTSGSGVKNENMSNNQLKNYTNQLLENLIKKKNTHLLWTIFIWGEDLADMQLTSKFNKRFRFLLCYYYLQQIYMSYSFKR